MYDLRFFRTRLGQAAMVSVAAMVTFVAFTSQAPANPDSSRQPKNQAKGAACIHATKLSVAVANDTASVARAPNRSETVCAVTAPIR